MAENDSDEVRRLRRAIRDMEALSALPATWVDLGPEDVARNLANVLLNTLGLDLVFIRLGRQGNSGFTETVRSRHRPDADCCISQVRDLLAPVLARIDLIPVALVTDPFGVGTLRTTVSRFDLVEDQGVLVAGSQRASFPTEQDQLLLRIAANHAAVVLQRHRAGQALQQSEERFRGFADAAPAMLWVTEPDGFCSFLSHGWYEFTGQDEDEGLGFGWLSAVHPDDREEAGKHFLSSNEREEAFSIEYRLRRADGIYGWIIDAGRPRVSRSGQFLGYAGNLLDITERKQAENELAQISTESERRRRLYETILSNTPDLVHVFDLNHRFTYANEVLLKMWGRTWNDAIGKNCLELGYAPWHAELHDREIEQVKVTKQPIRGEVPFTGTFGRRVYDYIFVPVLGPEGEVEAVAGTTRDVTDRKRSEDEMAALLAMEKRRAGLLAQVANASKSMNVVLSMGSIARILTEEARSILGAHSAVTSLTVSESHAQAISAVSLSEEYAGYRAYFEEAGGSEIDIEVCRTNRPMRLTQQEPEIHPAWKGFEKHAEGHPPMRGWLAVPLIGHGGKNLGSVRLMDKAHGEFTEDDEAILVQLAAIASAGIENARLYEQVREQDQRKDEFLATLAHELRNPLAPIRTGLAVLKLAPSVDATVKTREIMERQIEHMVRLIDDLLDVSRIASGKIQLNKERVDVRTVLDTALELSRPLIEENRHGLFISTPEEPLLLDADPTRMSQVVSNLLNNAAKYTPQGGRIELSAERDGSEVIIRVRDNGVGLTPEALPKVFELFSQVGKTLDRSQGGLGIGLALVKRLVEMHGGHVTAESQGAGQGSTFAVRLPLAMIQVTTGKQTAGEQVSRSLPVPRRILVVDDNVDGAETLAMLLMLSGHTVETVHTGPDALKAAQTFQPHVMFLDIGLPGMSGYEVAQQLRSDSNMNGMILVALTGWGSEEDRRRAQSVGFDHHLTKPVDIERLQSLLMEIDANGKH